MKISPFVTWTILFKPMEVLIRPHFKVLKYQAPSKNILKKLSNFSYLTYTKPQI